MTRSVLDAKLHEISTKITQLGISVLSALEQALQALQNGDQALCRQVIESDKAIDELRFEVERLAFQVLTLQQPLGGRDLRFLSSISSIARDLERMGDNAAGTAKLLLLMHPLRTRDADIDPLVRANGNKEPRSGQTIMEETIMSELLALGQESCRMLQGAIEAFKQNDASIARKTCQGYELVADRSRLVHKNLTTLLTGEQAISALQRDSLSVLRMTYSFWIAHNLKRFGDHCVHVCKCIVFVLEGKEMVSPIEIA